MLAQRVPPSACSTSQSMCRVRSPSFFRSTTARRLRPIRRWISWVRPDCLPRAASRSLRVWVERGSMPYSAVTQPSPLPFLCGGILSSTLAVHSTRVSPMRPAPSLRHAWCNWRVKDRVRSASGARPLGRAMGGHGGRSKTENAILPRRRAHRRVPHRAARLLPIWRKFSGWPAGFRRWRARSRRPTPPRAPGDRTHAH